MIFNYKKNDDGGGLGSAGRLVKANSCTGIQQSALGVSVSQLSFLMQL